MLGLMKLLDFGGIISHCYSEVDQVNSSLFVVFRWLIGIVLCGVLAFGAD